MMSLLQEIFGDYTLRNVVMGSIILGLVSGALGSFAVLRRQSLLGDTISHAALPGIALAFLLTGSKEPFVLLLGAAAAGWIGTLLILSIIHRTVIREDAAQGIILSVFFGLGMVLLTYIQKLPDASQAGLDRFLFGQAATLLESDIRAMAILGILVAIFLALLWKEFKLISFDPGFAAASGLPIRRLEVVLTSLIVVAIVIGLQTVGVVLMSAMLVAPGASARQWTRRLGPMTALSAGLGAVSGLTGALLSASIPRMPTGPTIVLVLTGFSLLSILFGSERGLVQRAVQRARNRKIFAGERILEGMLHLAQIHEDRNYAHMPQTLTVFSKEETLPNIKYALSALETQGLVQRHQDGSWSLSDAGYERSMKRLHDLREAEPGGRGELDQKLMEDQEEGGQR